MPDLCPDPLILFSCPGLHAKSKRRWQRSLIWHFIDLQTLEHSNTQPQRFASTGFSGIPSTPKPIVLPEDYPLRKEDSTLDRQPCVLRGPAIHFYDSAALLTIGLDMVQSLDNAAFSSPILIPSTETEWKSSFLFILGFCKGRNICSGKITSLNFDDIMWGRLTLTCGGHAYSEPLSVFG